VPRADVGAERFGQPFVIENRPGAGSNVGTELVVRAPADGHTLLLVAAPAAINATLYDNLSFNFIRDIAPVAGIVRVPEVMLVNPAVPASTVPELIAYAKANRARSTLLRPATARCRMLPASCSSSWPTSRWFASAIAAGSRR
jgi:tripartite-type tricarboxylate transporter receptor subunit TctC